LRHRNRILPTWRHIKLCASRLFEKIIGIKHARITVWTHRRAKRFFYAIDCVLLSAVTDVARLPPSLFPTKKAVPLPLQNTRLLADIEATCHPWPLPEERDG